MPNTYFDENIDVFIVGCIKNGINTCPDIAVNWMSWHKIQYTDAKYQHFKQLVNRHVKTMEKYGLVRYTGRTKSANDKSKIWELV